MTVSMSVIAERWRNRVLLDGDCQECENQAGSLGFVPSGESGGMFVESEEFLGRRVYLKPLIEDETDRAARKKIASDLAYEVGVGVPPAVLYRRSGDEAEEARTVLTLVMCPRQWSWGHIKRRFLNGSSRIRKMVDNSIPESAARAFAFDTWVGQGDHGDHPHNVVLGSDKSGDGDYQWIFLDYADALARIIYEGRLFLNGDRV